MRALIITLISIVTFGSAFGQDTLITSQGDTLTGKIEILFPEKRYEEILFENDDIKNRYKAHEFISFTQGDDIYKTIKSGDKYRIMLLEKPGYLSIFRYRMDENFAFAGTYLYRKDGMGIDVPTMMFKKTMANFLDDCNSVNMAIEEGTFKRKDLVELVDAYNLCIETNTKEQMAGRDAIIYSQSDADNEIVKNADEILNKSKELGDDELTSMLTDVIKKLRNNEKVPSYLKNAIQEHVGESHALYEEITGLLTLI